MKANFVFFGNFLIFSTVSVSESDLIGSNEKSLSSSKKFESAFYRFRAVFKSGFEKISILSTIFNTNLMIECAMRIPIGNIKTFKTLFIVNTFYTNEFSSIYSKYLIEF